MKKETGIKLFDSEQIRSTWNAEEEKWYFSITDVAVPVISVAVNDNAARKNHRKR